VVVVEVEFVVGGELVVLAVVSVVAVVVVAVMDVVVDDEDVVLVLGVGHVQPSRQSSSAPPADPDGQVALPGGSHCSPASTWPFPQTAPRVVVVAVVDVVVGPGAVVDVVMEVVVGTVVGTVVVVVVSADGERYVTLSSGQRLGST
jgi:hypothetical protein